MPIPVIDIFAGPGGLGEGFCSVFDKSGKRIFRIALSIEKDIFAHQTLLLRSFTRQFDKNNIPLEYYRYVRGAIDLAELRNKWPNQWESAESEAWRATLGEEEGAVSAEEVDKRIKEALDGAKEWVLVGGPPCQAYSIVGRSRSGGIDPKDHRVYLYREYYRILAGHAPPVFIMENVKGLLSAKLKKESIFRQILLDLKNPANAYAKLRGKKPISSKRAEYKIFSLTGDGQLDLLETNGELIDYVVRCEDYGIPQKRHRIILLGIRSDISALPQTLKKAKESVTLSMAIGNLHKIRSGLSEKEDTAVEWKRAIRSILSNGSLEGIDKAVRKKILGNIRGLNAPNEGRGNTFVSGNAKVSFQRKWYTDKSLSGVCNHQSKEHMESDLQRYFFAACFAQVHGRSPKLEDFPKALLPRHKSVRGGVKGETFADRFRVQLSGYPATTITSHLAKDGHYYIHPDPGQCRSFTVREAARIQTFPDNFFFCGPKTSQYIQVGNAVPPLLAKQIASVIQQVFSQTD